MSSDKKNESIDEAETSIAMFLEPDTPEILELKSLFNIEQEYVECLVPIEAAIVSYYNDVNRELLDKDVIAALKNIKQNYEKDVSFFKSDLEDAILEDLLEILEYYPLSHHEFKLLIDYILWVIDNRSWAGDEQAYLKWNSYALGFFSEEEAEAFEKEFRESAGNLGLNDAQIDMLLLKTDADEFFEEGGPFEGQEANGLFDKDTIANDLETGFFLMDDDEKSDFLLEQGPEYIDLLQSYVSELASKEDFDKLRAFYKQFVEKHETFFPVHFIVGIVHLPVDPDFAKACFEKTLEVASELEDVPEEMLEELKRNIEMLNNLDLEELLEDS